jgi:hypothetical protein
MDQILKADQYRPPSPSMSQLFVFPPNFITRTTLVFSAFDGYLRHHWSPKNCNRTITDMQLLELPAPITTLYQIENAGRPARPKTGAVSKQPNRVTSARTSMGILEWNRHRWRRQNGRSSRLSLAVLRRERWVVFIDAGEATASETLARRDAARHKERRRQIHSLKNGPSRDHPLALPSSALRKRADVSRLCPRQCRPPSRDRVAAGRYQAQQPPRNDRRPFLLDPRPHRLSYQPRLRQSWNEPPSAAPIQSMGSAVPDMVGPTNFPDCIFG